VTTPGRVVQQINEIVKALVESGLAGDQNLVFSRRLSATRVEVTFPQAGSVSIALSDQPYEETYDMLAAERVYVVKFPDGALVQMQYVFEGRELQQHRLAFFPSPHLEEFQNHPEVYLEEDIYADVVGRNVVPFPIRFDFDSRDGVWRELDHPKSHLTLGQYENCRIPVTSPLSPVVFLDFVLRNFYNTAFGRYADQLPKTGWAFGNSILLLERSVMHIQVPAL
jgi:hypothetical protein